MGYVSSFRLRASEGNAVLMSAKLKGVEEGRVSVTGKMTDGTDADLSYAEISVSPTLNLFIIPAFSSIVATEGLLL